MYYGSDINIFLCSVERRVFPKSTNLLFFWASRKLVVLFPMVASDLFPPGPWGRPLPNPRGVPGEPRSLKAVGACGTPPLCCAFHWRGDNPSLRLPPLDSTSVCTVRTSSLTTPPLPQDPPPLCNPAPCCSSATCTHGTPLSPQPRRHPFHPQPTDSPFGNPPLGAKSSP